MSVYDVTYETLGYTHPVFYNAVEMGEYSPYKKVVELERSLSFTLSSIKEISLKPH